MLKCAAVFSDNMVLQKGKSVAVFGEGIPERRIEATLVHPGNAGTMKSDAVAFASCIADRDGKWQIKLPAVDRYYADLELIIESEDEAISFDNVAVGEVFLAGGQSNMEREMGTALDGQEVLARVESAKKQHNALSDGESPVTAAETSVRFFYTQKHAYFDEHFFEDEAANAWQLCGSEWMKAWSAVGFFFARKLAEELNCVVGIIGCNWGGTSAACWMDREDLLARESTRIYVDEYDNSPDRAGRSEQEQIKEYEEYTAAQIEWDRKSGELYATVPGITWDEVQERIGKCRYPGPMNCANFIRPYGLYETMLKRVAPYTVQGFIYYQGENDDHRPESYYDMMQALIACWRREFDDADAAFILTQLPMHRYSADPDWKNWPTIREAQMKAAETISNVGAAVIIDQGEYNEIHPKYKRRVGERLALQALWKIYKKTDADEACGPRAEKAVYKGNGEIMIEYTHCRYLQVIERLYGNAKCEKSSEGSSSGDIVLNSAEADAQKIIGFEIAGEDGTFIPAEAYLPEQHANCLIVKCTKDIRPVSVRYLWTNYCEVNLYGENKADLDEPLPAEPFRMEVVQSM